MWMSRHPVGQFDPTPAAVATVAVAVPACNEADSITDCLRALDAAAAKAAGSIVHVLVLVNNSGDGTAALARRYRPRAIDLHVMELTLQPDQAHAGGARARAFAEAAALLPASGVLLTTDADSRVDPDWIIANLAELAAGADAVAGVVAFDDAARAALPALPMRSLEWRLAELHARLGTLLDPRAHDPWPNHIWAWGASLAITLAAYRRVGGIPPVPLAEDRAMAAAIERLDLRLRHSHAPVVFTSARRAGRAPGGFADLLQSYIADPATPCDAALEPTASLVHRLTWRARLRGIAAAKGIAAAGRAARPLGYRGTPAGGFGALWSEVEACSAALVRTRVLPDTLETEVALAERAVSRATRRATGRADILASARAG